MVLIFDFFSIHFSFQNIESENTLPSTLQKIIPVSETSDTLISPVIELNAAIEANQLSSLDSTDSTFQFNGNFEDHEL